MTTIVITSPIRTSRRAVFVPSSYTAKESIYVLTNNCHAVPKGRENIPDCRCRDCSGKLRCLATQEQRGSHLQSHRFQPHPTSKPVRFFTQSIARSNRVRRNECQHRF